MDYAISLDTNLLNISEEIFHNGIFRGKRSRDSDGAFDAFFSKHIIDAFKQISIKNLLHIYTKVGETLCKLVIQIVTHRDFFRYINQSDITKLCFLAKALLDTAFHIDTSNPVDDFINIWSRCILIVLNCINIFTTNARIFFINDIYKCLLSKYLIILDISRPDAATFYPSFVDFFNILEVHTSISLNGVKVTPSEHSINILLTLIFNNLDDLDGYETLQAGEILSKICLDSSFVLLKPLLIGISKFPLSHDSMNTLLQLIYKSPPLDAREVLIKIIYKNIDLVPLCQLMEIMNNVDEMPSNSLLPINYGKYIINSVGKLNIHNDIFRRNSHLIDWKVLFDYVLSSRVFMSEMSLVISIYGLKYINIEQFYNYLENHFMENPTLEVMASLFHVILSYKTTDLLDYLTNLLEERACLDDLAKMGIYVLIAAIGTNYPDGSLEYFNKLTGDKFVLYLTKRLLLHLHLINSTDDYSGGVKLLPESPLSSLIYSVCMYSGRSFIAELARYRNKFSGIRQNQLAFILSNNPNEVICELKQSNVWDFLCKTIFCHISDEGSFDNCVTLDGKCCIVAPITVPFRMVAAVRKLISMNNDETMDLKGMPAGVSLEPHALTNTLLKSTSFNEILANLYKKSFRGDVSALICFSKLCYQSGVTLSHLLLKVSGYQVYKCLACDLNFFKFPSNELIIDSVKPFPRLQYFIKMIFIENMIADQVQQYILDNKPISPNQSIKYDFNAFFHQLLIHLLQINGLVDYTHLIKLLDNSGFGVTSDALVSSFFPIFSKILFASAVNSKIDVVKIVQVLEFLIINNNLNIDFWDIVFHPTLDLIVGLGTMNPLYYPVLSSLLRDKFQVSESTEKFEYISCSTDSVIRLKWKNSPISDRFLMCQCNIFYFATMSLELIKKLIEINKAKIGKFAYSIIGAVEQIVFSNNLDGLKPIVTDIFNILTKSVPKRQINVICHWKQTFTGEVLVKSLSLSKVVEMLLATTGNEYELIAQTEQLLQMIKTNPLALYKNSNYCIKIRNLLLKYLIGGVRKGQLSRNIMLLIGLMPIDNMYDIKCLCDDSLIKDLNSDKLPKHAQLAHYLLINVISPHVATKVGALAAQRLFALLGYNNQHNAQIAYPSCNLNTTQRFEKFFKMVPQLKPFTTSLYECTKDINMGNLREMAEHDFQYFIWWLLQITSTSCSGDDEVGNMYKVFKCCDLGMCEIPKLASHLLPLIVEYVGGNYFPEISKVISKLLEQLIRNRKSVFHVQALLSICDVSFARARNDDDDFTKVTIPPVLKANAVIYCGNYAQGVYLLERLLSFEIFSFNFMDPEKSIKNIITNGVFEVSPAILLAKAFWGLGDTPSIQTLLSLDSSAADDAYASRAQNELLQLVLQNKTPEALAKYHSDFHSKDDIPYLLFRIAQKLPINYYCLFFNSLPEDVILTNYSRGDALEACWKLRNWHLMDKFFKSPVKNVEEQTNWLNVLGDDAIERNYKVNYSSILLNLSKGNDDLSIYSKTLDDLLEPTSFCLWNCRDNAEESDQFTLNSLMGKLKRVGFTFIASKIIDDFTIVEKLFPQFLSEIIPSLRASLELSGRISESIQIAQRNMHLVDIFDLYQMTMNHKQNLPGDLVNNVICEYACFLIDSSDSAFSGVNAGLFDHQSNQQLSKSGVKKGLSLLEQLANQTGNLLANVADQMQNTTCGNKNNILEEYVYRCARLNTFHPSVTIPMFKQVIGKASRATLEYAKYLDSLIDKKLSNAYAVKIVQVNNEQKLVGLTGVTVGMSFLQLLTETFKMYFLAITHCDRDLCSLVYILNRIITLACIFCTPKSRDLYQNIWFDENCCNLFFKAIISVFQSSFSDTIAICWYTVLPQIVSRSRHKLLGKFMFQPIIEKLLQVLPRHSLWHALHRLDIERATSPICAQYKMLFEQLNVLANDTNVYRDGQKSDIKRRYTSLWNLFRDPGFLEAKIVSPTSSQMAFLAVVAERFDFIVSINNEIDVLPSKQQPKRIVWVTSGGFKHAWLIKNENKGDLRKDSRMMEIVAHTNSLASAHNFGDNCAGDFIKRHGTVPTFSVYLLSEKCGVIEWIDNMQTFGSAIREQLRRLSLNERKVQEAQKRYMKFVADGEFAQSHRIFCDEIIQIIPPVLHRVYMQWFGDDPLKWYKCRRNYVNSTALWSILGFIVGLGDRHGDNLLLSKSSGEVMHVDFDCLFGKGLKLAVPELVPFRLTQNVIAAMGICGILPNSPFMQNSLEILTNLRGRRKHLLSILLSFVFDPLIEWERTDKQAGVETGQCVTRQIEHKLKGAVNFTCISTNSNVEHNVSEPAVQGLEPTRQLELLVDTATSSCNLSRMFVGWAPWL